MACMAGEVEFVSLAIGLLLLLVLQFAPAPFNVNAGTVAIIRPWRCQCWSLPHYMLFPFGIGL